MHSCSSASFHRLTLTHLRTRSLCLTLPLSHTLIRRTTHNSTSHPRCVVFGDRWRRRLEWQCSRQSGRQTAGAGRPGRPGLSKVLADPRRLRGRRGRLHVRGRRRRLQRLVQELSTPRKRLLNKLSWAVKSDLNAHLGVTCVFYTECDRVRVCRSGIRLNPTGCHISCPSNCSIICNSLRIRS